MSNTIRIFLASSEELRQERLEVADLVQSLNYSLEKRGKNLLLVKWEYMDSSMGAQHKQEDYNDQLKTCDICLVLYWKNFGMYTKTELDTAYKELCDGNNPKKIYIYFKDGEEEKEAPEMAEFKKEFVNLYGHFYCHFQNIDTLRANFLLQLINYISSSSLDKSPIQIEDSCITIDGVKYVDLTKVPFSGNNEEYNLICKSLKKTQKLLDVTDESNPEFEELATERYELEKKKSELEKNLWDTALLITKISTQHCTERLSRAIKLFNMGDNKGANAILKEEEIDKDVQTNLNLIQLGKEGKKGLEANLKEYELKIKTNAIEMADGWLEENVKLMDKIIEISKDNVSEEQYAIYLAEHAYYDYHFLKENDNAINYFTKAANIFKEINKANYLEMMAAIANVHFQKSDFNRSYKLYKDLLSNEDKLNKGQLATYLSNMTLTCFHLCLYEEAERYNAQSIKIFEESENTLKDELNKDAYSKALQHKAWILQRNQQYDNAANFFLKAIDSEKSLVEENPKSPIFVNSLSSILVKCANLYTYTRKYEESKQYYAQALNEVEKLRYLNPKQYILTGNKTKLNYILCYLIPTNQLEEAEKVTNEIYNSVKGKSDINSIDQLIIYFTAKREIHDYKEECELAIKDSMELINCYKTIQIGNPNSYQLEMAQELYVIGVKLHTNLQNDQEAKTYLNKCLQFIKENIDERFIKPFSDLINSSKYFLGLIYFNEENYKESEKMFKSIEPDSKILENIDYKIAVFLKLGFIEHTNAHYENSIDYLEKAIQYSKENDYLHSLYIYPLLIDSYNEKQEPETALKYANEWFNTDKSNANAAITLGDCYKNISHPTKALEYYYKGLSLVDKNDPYYKELEKNINDYAENLKSNKKRGFIFFAIVILIVISIIWIIN